MFKRVIKFSLHFFIFKGKLYHEERAELSSLIESIDIVVVW